MKRPVATIRVTAHFARHYKHFSPEVKEIAEARERIFRANAFDPRLRTHKLSGRLEGLWAFCVTDEVRVIFEFLGADAVLLHSIGPHHVVYE